MIRSTPRGRGSFRRPGPARFLERATELSALTGQRTLVLLDEQNLSIGARNLGYELDYPALTRRIRSAASSAEIHVFTAAGPSHPHAGQQVRGPDHIVHVKTIRQWQLPGGRARRDANVDNVFSFWAGLLTAKKSWGAIVFGSGDYGLAGELPQAIRARRLRSPVKLMTLSLPGSTAQDLEARFNPNVSVNLEIGLDVLRPRPNRFRAARAEQALRFVSGPSMTSY